MKRTLQVFLVLVLWPGYGGLSHATLLAPEGAQLRVESTQGPAEIRYQRGMEALEREDLDAAESEFKASQQLDPSWAAPLLGLAEIALRRGNVAHVEARLRQAVALAPDDASTHTAIGRFALARGRFQEAEAALTRAVQLAPAAVEPRLELGGLYANGLKRPAEAAAAFASATRVAPTHGGAFHGLGMALLAQGKTGPALEAFQTAAQLAPDNPLPWHAQGRLHTSTGDSKRALQAYAEALHIQPAFVPSLIDRGHLHLNGGNWPEAHADFARAVRAAPTNAAAQLGAGISAQQMGDAGRARQAYLAAIESNPNMVAAYNNLAWLTVKQQGPTDQALHWAEEAVRRAPEVADFRDTLGWVLHLRGDNERARVELEKAAALNPQPHIHYHLGRVYFDLGRHEQAQRQLTRALAGGAEFEGAREASELLGSLRR